ncbi:MAG: ATP-binding protein [Candidatus Methanomethylophilaceae archaeon]|nr:ATP-binding protein [Candidatus Methanomethylophilaceae archaeon]MDY5872503.1 ATP-binding protein [Candidatus Methanomethylophilaceae archaeon]
MEKNLVPRERFLEKIRPVYDVDIIKVLMGPRRSGKSVILSMIADEVEADADHKIYINFEDLRYEPLTTAVALNEYVTGRMKEGKYYIFFDEIQNVKDFAKVLASLKSTGMCSIFVTGSNSKMLSGELSTLITGRTIQFEILPFSYSEAKEYMKLTTGSVPENFLSDYIKFGGYPQRFQMGNESLAHRFLEELYKSIVEKDIHNRHPDLDMDKFERVASFVLANCGNDFSAKTISGYLKKEEGIDISIQSVHNYLNLMEETYLLKRVSIYDISGKAVMSSKPKNYALDNGFRYIKTNTIDVQNGYFLENLIYLELLGRGYKVYVGKKYNGEIDFVAVRDGKKCFIQVAYLMIDDVTVRREFGAFASVRDASPKYVISMDPFDMSRDGITHINLLDFLEGKKDLYVS